MAKKVILCCDRCGSRNYTVPAKNSVTTERLTLNKYCNHCNSHTLHKQTV